MSPAATAVAVSDPRPGSGSGALRDQAVVLGGQVAAGLGNLAFAVVAARILGPGEFAALAAFLAVYLLVHVPSASLGAGAALDPARTGSLVRRLMALGWAAAGITVVASSPIGRLANLDLPLVLALAIALPAASVLGLRRGVLYGHRRTGRVSASLAVEPAIRLALGLPLLLVAGAAGGAIAVTVGGWVGAAVATSADLRSPSAPVPPTTAGPAGAASRPPVPANTSATAITFFVFALVANQDLLVANAVLDAGPAGAFAVLSVVGGAVAFATATIPLVLLPRSTRAATDTSALRVAVVVTLALATAAVLVAAVVPELVLAVVAGTADDQLTSLLVPYLVAMGALAFGRVLAAHHCSVGRGRAVAIIVSLVVVVHLAVLVSVTRTPGAIAASTLGATAAAAVALLALPVWERRRTWTPLATRTDVAWIAAATLVAVVVRLLLTRGLWVDEAISVQQAQMGFAAMIDDLRTTDVHPPLHHALLWVVIRLGGAGELAVRLPSITAGAALVPVLYHLGLELYGRQTARIAAACAVVAPFLVWYSQEARMYSLFMLAAAVAVLGQVRALRTGAWSDWALYVVATAAMAWTQYFAVLPIAVQQTAFLVALWQRRSDRADLRRTAIRWLVAVLALVVLLAPMVPIALDQLAAYTDRSDGLTTITPGVDGPVDTSAAQGELSLYAAVANGIWGLWGYHADSTMAQIAALWPLAMLAGLLMLGGGRSRHTPLMVALVVVPALALFGVGMIKRDLFELRYFAGAVPIALVLCARAVTRMTATTTGRAVAGTALVLTLLVGLVDQQLNGANPRRYDFAGAVSSVDERWQDGDILLYEPTYLNEVVTYYGDGLDIAPVAFLTGSRVDDAPTVYVLATQRVMDEEETAARIGDALARLEQRGRVIVERIDHANVTVWELR
ncbi:MAG: glycosyltransferase family 39 protein [Acidimicrobiales bacterium]